jgi:hypothetical protein
MSSATSHNQVTELLSRFDTAWVVEPRFGQDDWSPESPEIAEALTRLLSAENRPALHAWYADYSLAQLNPSARWFCEYLERRIGTPLARRS